MLAYLVGKPLGILSAAWVAVKSAPRRAALSVKWGAPGGTALSAGVGVTVSLPIASRAFHGVLLDEARLGILATALLAPAMSRAAFTALRRHAATPLTLADCAPDLVAVVTAR